MLNDDQPALAPLTRWYRQYAPLVHARAQRVVGAEADDVVQEVFERLLSDRPDEDRLLPWMYATSTHICLDRLRHRRRRDRAWQDQVADDLGRSAGHSHRVDDLLASRDLCLRLLTRSDRKTRAVAMLIYFDEMTHEQAAELLGVSRKTIIERLKRFSTLARKSIARWQT